MCVCVFLMCVGFGLISAWIGPERFRLNDKVTRVGGCVRVGCVAIGGRDWL